MIRPIALVLAVLAVSACAPRVVPPSAPRPVPPPPVVERPPVVTPPTRPPAGRAPLPSVPARGGGRAADAGLRPGPVVAALPITPVAASRALEAFRISCPSVTRRNDRSGLTRPSDWETACAAAARWSTADALAFFAAHFESVEVGDGAAFATGYFEPEIEGCRTPRPGCNTPVYRLPPGTRNFTRAQIEDGALAGRGLELAYAVDPIDLFFLEIQGSGRLRLSDGSIMRIGYAGQNGRAYTAIGGLLRQRGILPREQISLQSIQAWLRANPADGRALMRENQSYVYFRELTGPGPIGSIGVPVTPQATVAVDPNFVTYGAPVLLGMMSESRADGLWVAQDTGGAIRGANRFDTFWGPGAQAAAIAGPMQARGRALILLPRGTLERLASANASAQP